jgi:hypothetical protein
MHSLPFLWHYARLVLSYLGRLVLSPLSLEGGKAVVARCELVAEQVSFDFSVLLEIDDVELVAGSHQLDFSESRDFILYQLFCYH